MAQLLNIFLLFLGFVFSFFIPGYLILETFFSKFSLLEKIALTPILSVLFSTYLVFIASLIFGYSAETILLTSLPFFVWTIILIIKKYRYFKEFKSFYQDHFWVIFLSLSLFILFFLALYPAIFFQRDNYYVMSAVNWQDTAMHASIIETISQGNFPPQAPYFSGQPLSYYYFVDFHSAILETLFGNFFPRVLVYDNPFFILSLALAVYCLAFQFFQNKKIAIISVILVSLFGNFMFINLLTDTLKEANNLGFWNSLLDHLTNKGYTGEFGGLMQITPMADYFLQNRPMMVGLPAFILVNLLLIKGFEQKDNRRIILAGVITALLIKFQLFAFVTCGLAFVLGLIIYNRPNLKNYFKKLLIFGFPIIASLIFFSLFFQTGQTLTEEFLDNLSFGLWDKNKDLVWFLKFYLANFGLPFLVTVGLILGYLFSLIKKFEHNKKFTFLMIEFLILFAIPHLVKFTVYEFDMFKFFYFMVVPMSILTAVFLTRLLKIRFIGLVAVALVLIISSLNSLSTLAWSYLNKYQGYSQQEYLAGVWIRQNTPQRSVFLTLPTVHSAVSEIGGRLRVLSYIVWPYSHGFNKGEDNVFSRQAEIEKFYNNPSDADLLKKIKQSYKINYIYLGSEESAKFPLAKDDFKRSSNLKLVYETTSINIYQIK